MLEHCCVYSVEICWELVPYACRWEFRHSTLGLLLFALTTSDDVVDLLIPCGLGFYGYTLHSSQSTYKSNFACRRLHDCLNLTQFEYNPRISVFALLYMSM